MNFLKRFPATMKEIANEMESRDSSELTKLIKLRNEAMKYNKAKKKLAKCKLLDSDEKASMMKQLDQNAEMKLKETSPKSKPLQTTAAKIDFSPVKHLQTTSDGIDFKNLAQKVMDTKDAQVGENEEQKGLSSLVSLVALSDNNMAFNIFPKNTIHELLNESISSDERCKLLEITLSFMRSTKRLEEKFHSSASFSKFILAVIDKVDDECLAKLLQILRITVDNKCIKNFTNLQEIFKNIVKHLGSKTVDIRQETMRVSLSIMKSMPVADFLDCATEYLSSNNWRIREEILNLIIISIMNKIEPGYDYQTLIFGISKLINDDNPKVRFVAKEALAILANRGDKQKVMDLCGQVIVHNEYLKISERLENNMVLTFNEKNLMFEYPKQPIKPMTLEKTKIKIRESPDARRNNQMVKKLSNRQRMMSQYNPQEDTSPTDYMLNTMEKNKNTMLSFDRSDYTEADSMIVMNKTKKPIIARKIRLKSIPGALSPVKNTKRTHNTSVDQNSNFGNSQK